MTRKSLPTAACRCVISIMMTSYTLAMPEQSKIFIDEARKSGVRHIVHLGACGDDNTRVAHWA